MLRPSLLFILVLIFSCRSSVNEDKIYEKEIKTFFVQFKDSVLTKKRFVLTDSVLSINKEWEDLFILSAINDKTLSRDDIEYVTKQFDVAPNFVWTNTIINSARIFSQTDIDNYKKSTGNIPAHYKFSLPYFSKDKTYCILYYYYYCGNGCNGSYLELYKKESGRWSFVSTLYRITT